MCAEGAVTLRAAVKLARSGWIKPAEKVVPRYTESGLKYPETVVLRPPVLGPEDRPPPPLWA